MSPTEPPPPSPSALRRVRLQQAGLYVLGVVTLVLVTGFTGWLIYAVGTVWWRRVAG